MGFEWKPAPFEYKQVKKVRFFKKSLAPLYGSSKELFLWAGTSLRRQQQQEKQKKKAVGWKFMASQTLDMEPL